MTFTPTPCLSVRHQLQNLVEYLFFVHDNTDETWWRGMCGTRKTLGKKMQFKTCYGVSYSNYLHLKSERNEIYSFSPKIFFCSAVNSTSSGKLNNYFLLSAFDFNFS